MASNNSSGSFATVSFLSGSDLEFTDKKTSAFELSSSNEKMSQNQRQRIRLKNFFPRTGLEDGLREVQNKVHIGFEMPVFSDLECEDVGVGFILSLTVQENSNVYNAQMFLPKSILSGADRIWQITALDQLVDEILLQARRY